MKYIASLLLLITFAAYGASVIFSGDFVKTLKPNIKLRDTARILTLSVDPSAVATLGETGSLALGSNGNLYIKQDAGTTTNWELLADATELAGKANTSLSNLASVLVNADLRMADDVPVMLQDPTNSNELSLKAPDPLAAAYTYVFPPDMGANGECLQTNGTVADWGSCAGLSIGNAISGGTASRVLFEDTSNQLAEDSGLRYNATTDSLAVGGNDPQANLHINDGTLSTVEFQMTNSNSGNGNDVGFEIELLTDSSVNIKNNSTNPINFLTNNVQRFEISNNSPEVAVGRDDLDTAISRLRLYGPSSGDPGSELRLHLSAAHDTSFDFFGLWIDQDDFHITDGTNEIFKLFGNNGIIILDDPSTTEGLFAADPNNGAIELSSGNDSFAFIDFKDAVADDFDARIAWSIVSSLNVLTMTSDVVEYTGAHRFDETNGSIVNTGGLISSATIPANSHGIVQCHADDLLNNCTAAYYTNSVSGIVFQNMHTCTGLAFTSLSGPRRVVCQNNTGVTKTMYLSIQIGR